MTPNYVVKKSVVPVLNFWLILFFWLIVPLIVQICRIVIAKSYSVEFYDNKIVTKSGVFNKSETQSVLVAVNSVSLEQSFMGRIFNYGSVMVDCRGKWDVDTEGIKDPRGLKEYLESRISASGFTSVIS
jgi:uncharacterized membrane protein YdbT with pleckstrin-like domain